MTNREQVLAMARFAKSDGITVVDVRERLTVHHGSASGTLSHLHEDGELDRLALRRDGSAIYVLPQHVAGRFTAPRPVRSSR